MNQGKFLVFMLCLLAMILGTISLVGGIFAVDASDTLLGIVLLLGGWIGAKRMLI